MADAAFPIIDRVLREEGVPLDFRYLVLQESALRGDARSNHAAVGYWQLKQETATGLGLVVNEEVDERQHLTASTRAAARYLTRNNAALRNWLNALLSYNTGLTGVKPYTLPTDADATEMAITEATSPYVLMFLAQKIAFEPACGQNPRPPLRLQEFPATSGQTLESQAQLLHVEPATLAAHNHWLLAPAVPADRPYTLIVPVGDVTQAAGIVANQRLQSSKELLALPAVAGNAAEVEINNLRALIALPGETTVDLARRANQKLGEFLRHNEMTGFDAAVTGRPYYLESKPDAGAVEYHVLQPGETIFDVAQKYGMRQKAVYAKNRMARVEELRSGRVLWLQHTRPREVAVEYRSLPEGAALERPATAATPAETDALVERANEAAATLRESAPDGVKVKVKIKVKNGGAETREVVRAEADGWGEALSTATAAAPSAPAPAPVVALVPELMAAPASAPLPTRPAAPAAPTIALPPPAPAPAPAPLADEPTPVEAGGVPVESLPTEAPAPAPVSAPAPRVAAPGIVYTPARPALARPVVAPPAAAPRAPAAAVAGLPAAAPSDTYHRVEPGETVYSVSRRFQVPPATLIAINQLPPSAKLVAGQMMLLKPVGPAGATLPASRPTASADPNATTHTVAVGETLYSISRLHKVTVADLQAWNGRAATDTSVKIGEELRVVAGAK
ncbi:hypothetical protein GCM10022407_15060 [Hymenobacter antarcticus]|uniref:LysM domain-containing protein n=1 Tax=Hymenobacter antarcticus TaxID=486270 RepID=A0ABP7PSJ0_9BACT